MRVDLSDLHMVHSNAAVRSGACAPGLTRSRWAVAEGDGNYDYAPYEYTPLVAPDVTREALLTSPIGNEYLPFSEMLEA